MSNSKLKILIFVSAVAAAVAAPLLAADTKTISSVEVQEVDGVTRVILRGAEDPIYTAFMRQDPPRLIVEMPDVTFSGVASPIAAAQRSWMRWSSAPLATRASPSRWRALASGSAVTPTTNSSLTGMSW